MNWSEDVFNKTKQFGIHGYPLSKCLLILDIEDEAAYASDFEDSKSPIARAYAKGQAYAEFAFDNILFKKGTEGDLNAMREYEKRKTMQKIRNAD
jgi:hypothetical protein